MQLKAAKISPRAWCGRPEWSADGHVFILNGTFIMMFEKYSSSLWHIYGECPGLSWLADGSHRPLAKLNYCLLLRASEPRWTRNHRKYARQEIEHLSHAKPYEPITSMIATVMQMKRTFQQRYNRVVARHSKWKNENQERFIQQQKKHTTFWKDIRCAVRQLRTP